MINMKGEIMTTPTKAIDAPGTPGLVQEEFHSSKDAKGGAILQGQPQTSGQDLKTPQFSNNNKTAPPNHLDDLDRMLCHEDFKSLLTLAVRVKQVREAITSSSWGAEPKRTASEMDPQQVINAVSRMQEQHLQRNYANPPVIRRGTYHLTDSLLNENFHILQQEMERCTKYIEQAQHQEALEQRNATASTPKPTKSRSTTSGDAICNKYAKWQTDILMNWMLDHVHHPFPTATQIDELCDKTGLNNGQVVNWTTNMRKRSLKASVEKKKKPHHFLDYKFMANDREQKEKQQRGLQVSRAGTNHGVPDGAHSQGPYSSAIQSKHHFYSQGPSSGQYQPEPSMSFHEQEMSSPRSGYQQYHDRGQPQAFYGQSRHYPHKDVSARYGSDSRQDVDSGDLDWEHSLQQVSETFQNPENAYSEPEFYHTEGDDPLFVFAQGWGGNAEQELRDDVMADDCIMETTDDFQDLDFDMNTTEYHETSPHRHVVDPATQHGNGGETWSAYHEQAMDTSKNVYDPFGHFHEVHPDNSRIGKQGSTGSFSLGDMSDFESELDMETSALDMPDLLVEEV